jgi:hypothetical protein
MGENFADELGGAVRLGVVEKVMGVAGFHQLSPRP